ncbi:RES family NAD+ phosphorylase [Ectothiorhodospira marina]|nr:RES family NAD+ phosphorylase [Ectothiorhodospira marina]
MQVWRLTTSRHAKTAFSGMGNRKVGSRWVPEGLLAVYTSENLSTAVLETLVHINPNHFSSHFVCIRAEIPEPIPMDEVSLADLPEDWRSRFEDRELQQVGAEWIERGSSAILIVPSAVVPQERNIIINPRHEDFAKITVGAAEPYLFDTRLLKS